MTADIQKYFEKLKNQCDASFADISNDKDKLGEVHHLASRLFELSELISDKDESELIGILPAQLESGTLNLCFGLYRQAFFSLRLFLELSLGLVHFSAHKIEHKEWLAGSKQGDISWKKLIDPNNGVLSVRFSRAFLPELEGQVKDMNVKSVNVYRELSQFVHGNLTTWEATGLKIERIPDLEKLYFEHFTTVKEVVITCLACRYLSGLLDADNGNQQIELLFEELSHVDKIRTMLGRE